MYTRVSLKSPRRVLWRFESSF